MEVKLLSWWCDEKKKVGITKAIETYQELDKSACNNIQSRDHRLMVHVWDRPAKKLLEPSSRWVADSLHLCSYSPSYSTVNTPGAENSTLLRLLFIIDPVSPKRGRREPYDSAWPAGNRQKMKWYTNMSRVPYSSISPCAEGADLEELIQVAV